MFTIMIILLRLFGTRITTVRREILRIVSFG